MARRAARWAGYDLTDGAEQQLGRYAAWLSDEAIPAGLVGREEGSRIWSRHVADSLSYAKGWPEAPKELWDLGSGAGLPGIPLAILWPETKVVLVERGQKRADLLARALRMLDLRNARPRRLPIEQVEGVREALTVRAVFSLSEIVRVLARLLAPSGTAVMALTRRPWAPETRSDLERSFDGSPLRVRPLLVPSSVLDGPSTLLIMTRRE